MAEPEVGGLEVQNLRVDAIATGADIVADVALHVTAGSAVGIVGESGSGKTTVARALLGAASPGAQIVSGSVRIGGVDLLALNESGRRSLRGRLISFVPQTPSRALSPGMRVGRQLAEMVESHRPHRSKSPDLVSKAWTAAQLPSRPELFERYPHEFSGGQLQRIAIAMALVCEPSVIVMDEPTTGLDVITQARLLTVIRDLRAQERVSIVYISHNLSVVRNLVDTVYVMYGGRIVEKGPVDELFRNPRHPYTRRLLEAVPRTNRVAAPRGIPGAPVEPSMRPIGCPFAPRCEFATDQCALEMPPHDTVGDNHVVRCWHVNGLLSDRPLNGSRERARVAETSNAETAKSTESPALLSVTGVSAGYAAARRLPWTRRDFRLAVRGFTFDVLAGACTAIVGESGSGKSTLARCLAGLHAPIAGEIRFEGEVLAKLARQRHPRIRKRIQIVFQDPDSSLNPSMTCGASIRRPLRKFYSLSTSEEARRVDRLLAQVHLPATIADRFPRHLSGGEKQRVALARALAAEPDLLICDEVTASLDVAVQASILELLEELRRSSGMAILFISHDLAVVRNISDNVIVMHDGEMSERASSRQLFAAPHDIYTRELLAAVPELRENDYPYGMNDGINGQLSMKRADAS